MKVSLEEVVRNVIGRGLWDADNDKAASVRVDEADQLVIMRMTSAGTTTYFGFQMAVPVTGDEVNTALNPSTMHSMRFAREWCVRRCASVAVFMLDLPPRVLCKVLDGESHTLNA